MYTTLEKKDLEVGKRYKGYAVLNEYGQFEFTPCRKLEGSSRMRIVKTAPGYTLYESANRYRLSFTFAKGGSPLDTVRRFLSATTHAAVALRWYMGMV